MVAAAGPRWLVSAVACLAKSPMGTWLSPWAHKKVQHSLAGLSGSVVGDHCMQSICMVVCVVASVRVRLEHVCIVHGTALDSRLLC